MLTSLVQGRFGKSVAFIRGLGHFKEKFLIYVILNCIFLNRFSFQLSMDSVDLVHFMKAQGDFVLKCSRRALVKYILDV